MPEAKSRTMQRRRATQPRRAPPCGAAPLRGGDARKGRRSAGAATAGGRSKSPTWLCSSRCWRLVATTAPLPGRFSSHGHRGAHARASPCGGLHRGVHGGASRPPAARRSRARATAASAARRGFASARLAVPGLMLTSRVACGVCAGDRLRAGGKADGVWHLRHGRQEAQGSRLPHRAGPHHAHQEGASRAFPAAQCAAAPQLPIGGLRPAGSLGAAQLAFARATALPARCCAARGRSLHARRGAPQATLRNGVAARSAELTRSVPARPCAPPFLRRAGADRRQGPLRCQGRQDPGRCQQGASPHCGRCAPHLRATWPATACDAIPAAALPLTRLPRRSTLPAPARSSPALRLRRRCASLRQRRLRALWVAAPHSGCARLAAFRPCG